MSGPTLRLNITAPGQKSVEASVSAVERLAAALKDLPAASAKLLKLQKALQSPASGGGLKSGLADQGLITEVKNLSAQLNTSFASLEETIKKGWAKAAKAQTEGEAKAKKPRGSSASSNESVSNETEMLERAFREMAKQNLAQAEALSKAQASGARSRLKTAAGSTAGTQQLLYGTDTSAIASLRQYYQGIVDAQAAATAQVEAAYQRSIGKLDKQTKALVKAATMPAYQPAGPGWWEARIAEQEAEAARLEAAYQRSIGKLDKQTKALVKAATMPAYQPAGPGWWEAQLREQENALLKMQKLEAAFAASSKQAQAGTVLAARSQLDQGVSPEVVKGSFGAQALGAAQATSFGTAYANVHSNAQRAHAEIGRGTPQIYSLSAALRDAHSGARGLASGFGQMALTWGAIGPLLAGAAISRSFVSSVRIGASTTESLEQLKVLSTESDAAVAGLEKQLVRLGQTGPFGPREVATAMKTLSLAGLEASEIAQALKPALDFAIAGGVGIEKASESLVAIGTAYRYQAGEFGNVADYVAKAAAVSMSSVEGMMESFRASSIVAQAYGVTLKDTALGLALLANIGIRGSSAGTSLRQMYSELSGATASTRKAMERLKVDVVDPTTGRMKDMLTIAEQVSMALDKLAPKARISAIQALSNERGSKSIVALLAAIKEDPKLTGAELELKIKADGSAATNELQRLRKLIEDSAGFAAESAARLAGTPMKMLQGIRASFETVLLQAFKAVEPTLTVVASQLRNLFNSDGFTGGVTNAVKLMGAFISTLVESVDYLKSLVVLLAAGKGLQIMALAAGSAATAYGVLTGSLVLTRAGILGAGSAALAATPALTGMSLAASGLGLALRFLGPVTLAVGALGLAFEFLTRARKDDRLVEAEANALKRGSTLDSLLVERQRLFDVVAEMQKGTSAREADLKVAQEQAKAERELSYLKDRSVYAEKARRAQTEADRLKGMPVSNAGEFQAKAAYAQSELGWFDQNYKATEARIAKTIQENRTLAKSVEIMGDARRTGTPRLDGADWNSPGALAAAANKDFGELKNAKAAYDAREKSAEEAYRRQMELLDIKHKGQLVSEAQYSAASTQYSDQLYANKTQALERFIEDSKSLLASLPANPKLASVGPDTLRQIQEEVQQAQSQLAFLRDKNAGQQAARANTLDRDLESGLAKLRSEIDLMQAKFDIEQKQLGSATSVVAAEQAKADVLGKSYGILKKTNDELERAQKDLEAVYATAAANPDARGSNLDNTAVARLQAEIATLKAKISSTEAGVAGQADRAGNIARDRDLAAKNSWKAFIAEGQNAQRVLEDSRAQFMNGWVESGRTMWAEWLKNGKLSFSSLKNLLQQTLADISYKRFIAEPLSKVGESVFDSILKPVTKAGSDDDTSELGRAFRNLADDSTSLSSRLSQLGSSFWQLFVQAGNGLAAMLQSSGSSSLAGIGSAIAGFLGGGSGADPAPAGVVVGGPAFALGGAFSQGVQAFAKGAMLNSVIDSPHFFRFGAGGSSLGVAGEAGPEAIMPLSRGPGGELGVRAHGGGGAGTAVGMQTTVVVEYHGSGPAPRVERSQTGNRELVKVIIDEAAKDVSQGGPLRKSVQGVSNNRNLPRY